MADANDITDAIAQAAADGIASASADGRSATQMSIGDQLKARDAVAGQAAVAGTNDRGGPKSGWRGVRMARGITGGPSPQ